MSKAVLVLSHSVSILAVTDGSLRATTYLRRRIRDDGVLDKVQVVGDAFESSMGQVQPQPQTNGSYEEENADAAADAAESSNTTDISSSSGSPVPLDGEFFLMFFFVLLIVFAVLFLPVIYKFIRALVLRRKIGSTENDRNDPDSKKQTERSKDDVLDGIVVVKNMIAEESRQVRNANKTRTETDGSAFRKEEQYIERQQCQNIEPRSGTYYGTYYFGNKARVEKIVLTFAPHPYGGYVILGNGEVQSGETEISEGYLAPDGEAYFVEMGGINPCAVELDISAEELTARHLSAREVSDLIVLCRGKFDFTQPNNVFTGYRFSSTGVSRKYRLLLRPRDSTIRHVMSTISSSIHSRRRSSIQVDPNDENEEEEADSIEWTSQQGNPGFPCFSKA